MLRQYNIRQIVGEKIELLHLLPELLLLSEEKHLSRPKNIQSEPRRKVLAQSINAAQSANDGETTQRSRKIVSPQSCNNVLGNSGSFAPIFMVEVN